jgi:hypothetical protein
MTDPHASSQRLRERDPELAKRMRALGVPAPMERIEHVDWLVTALNHRTLGGKHVVRLKCGHTAITKSATLARCHECHQMILNGEDYEAFRHR